MSAPQRSLLTQPFTARADLPNTHPLTSYLLQLITIKRSNLCVSADVTSTSALLKLAEEVGDSICVLKTHADIIDHFSDRTITGLQEISRRKKFLIFEDRKFGDIGNTVQKQYTSGPLRIAHWAHITNAHLFPGPSIITALSAAATSTLASHNQSVSTEISTGTPRSSIESTSSPSPSPPPTSSTSPPPATSPSRPTTRKPSIVTATTTISQTFEPSPLPQPLSLSRSASLDCSPDTPSAATLAATLSDLGSPPHARGLLLLAQMSSADNLLTPEYTAACVAAARAYPDFVMGFVCQRALGGGGLVSFTPGVGLPPEGEAEADAEGEEEGGGADAGMGGREWRGGDGLGQQYRTPRRVVLGEGCDVVIVGRGILSAGDRRREAERYRREAWRAYRERVGGGGGGVGGVSGEGGWGGGGEGKR